MAAAMHGCRALCACRVIDESDVTGSARGVGVEADATSITNSSCEPCQAGARTRSVTSVRRYSPIVVAVRGRRTLGACPVVDVSGVARVARRSSEPRRAGARTRSVTSVRRHSPMAVAVRGRRTLGARPVVDVAGVASVARRSSEPR